MFFSTRCALFSFVARPLALFVTFLLAIMPADARLLASAYAESGVQPIPANSGTLSAERVPMLSGLRLHAEDPFKIDFIVDYGDSGTVSKADAARLVDYFLGVLTVPDKDLWVNLSPYEKDRVIADSMRQTGLGTDLLDQDYVLKQIASSLTNPETEIGKAYWAALSGGKQQSDLSKIWIMPDAAAVYEHNGTAQITSATLKVDTKGLESSKSLAAILPALTREVNSGDDFAKLRQIYRSMVLALWFKEQFRKTFFKAYFDAAKTRGIDTASPQTVERVYQSYVEAFKKGAYDLVKKESVPGRGLQKRRYFAGGFMKPVGFTVSSAVTPVPFKDGQTGLIQTELSLTGKDAALLPVDAAKPAEVAPTPDGKNLLDRPIPVGVPVNGEPLYLQEPYASILTSGKIKHVHIITAGGGGDALNGMFQSKQMQYILKDPTIKVTLFTSNLKRGEENPKGGPLDMSWLHGKDGQSVPTLKGSKYLYEVKRGLYVETPLTDDNLQVIEKYTAPVPLSEGKILDLLAQNNIDLVMADVGRSGKELAVDYMKWLKANGVSKEEVFVFGLDMGGDILARFPEPMTWDKKRDSFPEKNVRSPNTDAVFLNMFHELEKKTNLDKHILLGVAALGGDGELEKAAGVYGKDLAKKGLIVGALDNLAYIRNVDPLGNKHAAMIEAGQLAIPSEVSGYFQKRLLEIAGLHPILGEAMKKGSEEKTKGWYDHFSANDLSGGIVRNGQLPVDLFSEMTDNLSGGLIRNGSRTEWLSRAYPMTLFFSPQAITRQIKAEEMKDTKLSWMEINNILTKDYNYYTEMTDGNNERDRRMSNSILLKSVILRKMWEEDESITDRAAFIKKTLNTLRETNVIFPEVERDLESLTSVIGNDFSDVVETIVNKFFLPQAKKNEFIERLKAWHEETQRRIVEKKKLSFYAFAVFEANVLQRFADFEVKNGDSLKNVTVEDEPTDTRIDYFFKMVGEMFAQLESLSKEGDDVFAAMLAESIYPNLIDQAGDLGDFRMKLKALQEVIKTAYAPGKKSNAQPIYFMRTLGVEIFQYKYASSEDLASLIKSLSDFEQAFNAIPVYKENGLDNDKALEENVLLLVRNKMFYQTLPAVLSVFHDPVSLQRVLAVFSEELARVQKTVPGTQTKELPADYFLRILDFTMWQCAKQKIKTPAMLESMVKELSQFSVESAQAGRNVCPILHLMSRVTAKLDTFDQIMRTIAIFKEKVTALKDTEKDTDFEVTYSPQGRLLNLPRTVRQKLYQFLNSFTGTTLLDKIQEATFSDQHSAELFRAKLLSEFDLSEKEAYEKMRAAVQAQGGGVEAVKAAWQLSPQQMEKAVPMTFKDEKVIESKDVIAGKELLTHGAVAFGFAAGLISQDPSDILDLGFRVKIPTADDEAKSFLHRKIERAAASCERYGLTHSDLPLVVMTGYDPAVLEDAFAFNNNYGYGKKGSEIFMYPQTATQAFTKDGEPYNVQGQPYYAGAGAWGFIEGLILSGTIKQLHDKGVRYLSHSNINNPNEDIDAGIIGYFQRMQVDAGKKGETVPAVLVELTDYRGERGALAMEIPAKDGPGMQKMLVHESRWPKDLSPDVFKDRSVPTFESMSKIAPVSPVAATAEQTTASPDAPKVTARNYGTANYLIDLDRLWEIFKLKDLYTEGEPSRASIAERIQATEAEHDITPAIKAERMAGEEIYHPEFKLDDVLKLGPWVGLSVSRGGHFVSMKDPKEVFDAPNQQSLAAKSNVIAAEIYKNGNPLVVRLQEIGVLTSFLPEKDKNLRDKIIKMFLPNRVYPLLDDLAIDGYVPGPYRQYEVKATPEVKSNAQYRAKIIKSEIAQLCRLNPDKLPVRTKETLIAETNALLDMVLAYETGEGVIGDVITNAESNMIVRQCIKIIFFGSPYGKEYNPYAVQNKDSNEIALKNAHAAEQFAPKDMSAGVKFWFSQGLAFDAVAVARSAMPIVDQNEISQEIIQASQKDWAKDSQKTFEDFTARIAPGNKATYTVFTNDNGEIVSQLMAMQAQLRRNPELTIHVVPRSEQYGKDASYADILTVLEDSSFKDAKEYFKKGRLHVIMNSPKMGGPDARYFSPEVAAAIKSSDFILSVGCVNYEMLSGIKKEAYHLFMVHGATSVLVNKPEGFVEGDYVFVHRDAGKKYLRDFSKIPLAEFKEVASSDLAEVDGGVTMTGLSVAGSSSGVFAYTWTPSIDEASFDGFSAKVIAVNDVENVQELFG